MPWRRGCGDLDPEDDADRETDPRHGNRTDERYEGLAHSRRTVNAITGVPVTYLTPYAPSPTAQGPGRLAALGAGRFPRWKKPSAVTVLWSLSRPKGAPRCQPSSGTAVAFFAVALTAALLGLILVGSAGAGTSKGKASPGEFEFIHLYDKASPALAKKH